MYRRRQISIGSPTPHLDARLSCQYTRSAFRRATVRALLAQCDGVHHAVAAAVVQGRADWGVTIETVALQSDLRFRPLREEHYDFAIPRNRLDRPAVQAFLTLLRPGGEIRGQLEELVFSAQATDSGCCPDSG